MIASARHSVDETLCHSNLVKLRHALVEYASVHGSLPPAVLPGPDGKTAHSWRVLILPYLDSWGIDGRAIYEAYDMAEEWNAPGNRRLFKLVAQSRFACPCGPEEDTTLTSYVVIVGGNTLFPPGGTVSASKLPNNVDPILVIEISSSDIEWPEPRDLSVSELSKSSRLNSIALLKPHGGVIRYITLSGRLGVLAGDMSVDEVNRLASIDGQAANADEELP
ncbi:hypothetical protein K2D_20780 [Planctomycetes bacterium K2D]|uniref:DUF1559 domain-containing protein n=2 Tax=Botrimarina mediterranea TaxID=2528022 RepID=A0A518K7S9_9BACT|nr:hypothetical protein Spa11_20400 [Botrimarina mediterranea]QDV78471.1 hypothetical protein K2D_20780 [Planctomycetes bacterium K2D]